MCRMLQGPWNRLYSLILSPALGLLLVVMVVLTPVAGAAEDAELARVFDAFFSLGLDSTRSAAVENVKIERDGLEIELKSGRLWFAQPLLGRVTGAHFVGDGVVSMRANGIAGVNMLKATLSGKNSGVNFPGKMPADVILQPASGEKKFDIFQARFTEVFFRFTDGLDEELAGLMADGDADAGTAEDSFKKRNKEAFYVDGANMERDFILQEFTGIDRFSFFLAELKIGSEWLTYSLAHSSGQEVWIGTHPSQGAGVNQRVFTWTAFDLAEDYDNKGRWDADLLLDQKPLLDISKIEMTIDIPTTIIFSIDAKVTFVPLAEELSVVPFALVNNLGYGWWEKGGRPVTLKSVQDAEGHELPFVHKRNSVLVRMSEPLAPGQETTLRFQADEKTIIQLTDYSWNIINTYPWFPQHGYLGGKYAIDWTIRVKKPLSAIASGRLVETKEERGMQVTRWVMDKEVAFPSFIFGRFSSREDIYKSEKTGREITVGVHATPLGRLRGTTKMKAVSKEAMAILKLFEEFFGPYPYDRLDITQMAVGVGFGQAPPGLLFLTGEAFVSTGLAAELMTRSARGPYFHDFFAHEMAHQWFGHEVLWGRDEDVWLSEAFAEYASAIYVDQIDGSKKFQEKLKRWLDGAKMGERSGFPIAGAIYASAPSAVFAGDYRTNLIYNKGAYVVHMIRTLLGPDKFLEGMRAFLEAHSGGMVTTQMLKTDMEEVAGIPLGWFFDQWFYTAEIPTVKFSYSTQRSEDGGYLLTGRIVQDEDNWKQLFVPVYFDLGEKQPSIQRQAVSSPDFTFKAKLPSNPKRVWLDEEHTVLAKMVTDSKK